MMQQNSSPDCRFHTNQPRKFTKTFSQLLKCTKRFSLQTSANLQHDDYWERIFPWTPTQRMTSRGCGGKKKQYQHSQHLPQNLSPQLMKWQIRRHLRTGQQPFYGRFFKPESHEGVALLSPQPYPGCGVACLPARGNTGARCQHKQGGSAVLRLPWSCGIKLFTFES